MSPGGDSYSAEAHYQEARALEKGGRVDEALACCQRAIQLKPGHLAAQHMGIRLLAEFAAFEPERFVPTPPDSKSLAERQALPMISVIICSIDPKKFTAVCANYASLLWGCQYEIIGIHDARSLCEGYNRGAARAQGDIIVFSHDDIEIISPDFPMTLAASLQDHDMVGVAGSTRFPEQAFWGRSASRYLHGLVAHRAPGSGKYGAYIFGVGGPISSNIQVLDGVFFAVRRRVLESVKFDAETFDGFHFYDVDFSYRVFLAGFRIAVCNEILIVHQSLGNFGAEWQKYAERFLQKYRDTARTDIVSPGFWTSRVIRLETAQQVVAFFRSLVATARPALSERS